MGIHLLSFTMKLWHILLVCLAAFLATAHADRSENPDDVVYDDTDAPEPEPEVKPDPPPEPEPKSEPEPESEAQDGENNGSIFNAASYLTFILPVAVAAVWMK